MQRKSFCKKNGDFKELLFLLEVQQVRIWINKKKVATNKNKTPRPRYQRAKNGQILPKIKQN